MMRIERTKARLFLVAAGHHRHHRRADAGRRAGRLRASPRRSPLPGQPDGAPAPRPAGRGDHRTVLQHPAHPVRRGAGFGGSGDTLWIVTGSPPGPEGQPPGSGLLQRGGGPVRVPTPPPEGRAPPADRRQTHVFRSSRTGSPGIGWTSINGWRPGWERTTGAAPPAALLSDASLAGRRPRTAPKAPLGAGIR